jgi:adenylate cyclase
MSARVAPASLVSATLEQRLQAFLQRELGRSLSAEGLQGLMSLLGRPPGAADAGEHTLAPLPQVMQREVTVVLADLRGFTALTATQPAGVIINLLNRCLATLSEVILRYGGTIDKFMGDSVMALFGAPDGQSDDVDRALLCAVEMQRAMAALNEEDRADGLPELYMGIGINTGLVIAGRFGSAAFSQYTVIGDEVNLASRIESFSLRGQVLISEHTYQRCADLVEASGPMEVHVKGKSLPVRVREVVAIPSLGLRVPRAEIRRSHRVDVRLHCLLFQLQNKVVLPHALKAVILDVGYYGLQLELTEALQPFAELKLEFELQLVDFTVTDVYAKVVKCRKHGDRWRAGLEFTAISAETSARLQTFVQLLITT